MHILGTKGYKGGAYKHFVDAGIPEASMQCICAEEKFCAMAL